MTFSSVNPPVGWVTNEPLTHTQLNQINTNLTNALDKTGDNVASGGGISGLIEVLTGGEIDINSGGVLKSKSGSTVNFQSGTTTTLAGTNAISGTTTITGATTLNANLTTLTGKTVTMNSGSTLTANSGSTTNLNGATAVASTGTITLASGSTFNANSGSVVTITNSPSSNFKTTTFANFITPQTRTLINPINTFSSTTGSISSYGIGAAIDTGVGGTFIVPLRPHHGATLFNVAVGFFVGTAHAGIPANLPQIKVSRFNAASPLTEEFLSSTSTQTFPMPVSGAAYYNGGALQAFNFTCNQNNVIDNNNYIYYLYILNESGANSQNNNVFGSIILSFNAISSQIWSM